jgi:hypothetical protein
MFIARQKALADDPEEEISKWKPSLHEISAVTGGPIGRALMIIEEPKSAGDYLAMDDLIRESIGQDLLSIGPDLVAMGLVSRWSPKTHRIRLSALAELIVKRMQ